MTKKNITIGIVSALVCEILFGFSFLFTKKITASVSAISLLSWRYIFAFILINICIFARIIKVDFKGKRILPLVVMAVFQPVIYFIGETVGIKLTTASESGTIIACIPIATLVFSALILKEPPSRLQILGVSITVTGIILVVVMKGFEAQFNLIGYAMLLFAVVSASLYSVFSRKAAEFTSSEKTYIMIILGTIVFTAIALFENAKAGTLKEYALLPFANMNFLLAVLYLGAGCSIAAFLFFNTAIAYIGTNRTASFVGISTIVTVIAGIVILKERFSTFQGVGTALVLGGVYIANIIPSGRRLKV